MNYQDEIKRLIGIQERLAERWEYLYDKEKITIGEDVEKAQIDLALNGIEDALTILHRTKEVEK